MSKLENIVKKHKIESERVNNNRKETIKELYELRKEVLRSVKDANMILQKKSDELRTINETICGLQGHTYTEWIEHDGFLDRTWYYTRECVICGAKVRVDDEPSEFKEQQLRKVRKKEA